MGREAAERKIVAGMRISRSVLVLAAYVILTLLLTYPAILHLGDRLLALNEDGWIFYWNNWWTAQALSQGRSPFFTSLLFYPYGVSLASHAYSPLSSLLAAALQPLLGSVAAYNLTVLLIFVVGGYGAFLLCRELTGHSPAAFIGGAVYAFAPYHLTQALAHPHLASVQWLPYLVLYLERVRRTAHLRDGFMAGLFLALTAWSGLQLAVMGGLWVGLYLAYFFLPWQSLRKLSLLNLAPCGSVARRTDRSQIGQEQESTAKYHPSSALLRSLGLLVVTAVLLSLPVVYPVVSAWLQNPDPAHVLADEQTWGQTDLLAYIVPPSMHPLWGRFTQPIYERFVKNRAWMPYVGFAALVLSLYAALRERRATRFWWASGLVWVVLALGPRLRCNGQVHPLPLPYALLGSYFPFNTLRSPDRFNLLVPLSLAPLVALALARRRATWRFVLLAGGLILFEYLMMPLPMLPLLPDSPFFHEIAADGEHYAVLDLPMGQSSCKYWGYYQTIHGKPLVEGHVSRPPSSAYRFIESVSLLQALQYPRQTVPPVNVGRDLKRLAHTGVRYIIVHKAWADEALRRAYQYLLYIAPFYEDEQVIVYRTAPMAGRDYPILHRFAAGPVLSEAWLEVKDGKLVKGGFGGDRLGQGTMVAHLWWTALGPLEDDYRGRLLLSDGRGTVITQGEIRSLAEMPTSTWGPGALVRAVYTLPITLSMDPGLYSVMLAVGEEQITLPEGILVVRAGEQTWFLPARDSPGVHFGKEIVLRGYTLHRRGNTLELTLYWQAMARPGGDYKVFVHLFDPTTESIAAQDDAPPCRGGCPTSTWNTGQLIVDSITLPLWDVPPGMYQLAVGMYYPQTLERLPAVHPCEGRLPADRFVFPTPINIQSQYTNLVH